MNERERAMDQAESALAMLREHGAGKHDGATPCACHLCEAHLALSMLLALPKVSPPVDASEVTDEDREEMAESGGIAVRDLPFGAAEFSRDIRLRGDPNPVPRERALIRETLRYTREVEASGSDEAPQVGSPGWCHNIMTAVNLTHPRSDATRASGEVTERDLDVGAAAYVAGYCAAHQDDDEDFGADYMRQVADGHAWGAPARETLRKETLPPLIASLAPSPSLPPDETGKGGA